jgi:hypothetical protein
MGTCPLDSEVERLWHLCVPIPLCANLHGGLALRASLRLQRSTVFGKVQVGRREEGLRCGLGTRGLFPSHVTAHAPNLAGA